MQHFYDGQIRRYITQIVRLMSNFSYKDGKGNLTEVPAMYGDLTRQVANIIRENSENKIPSAPRMSIYITGLEQDASRLSDSSYINKVNIRERAYDEAGNEYLNTEGKNYTVERLMPTPYILTVNVDVWSSNTDQKLQILEQVLMLFNPSLEIQTTDNYIDWTSLSVVNLTNTTFSSRSIPTGTESDIDIATLTFSTPIYISPPVKVKRLGVITQVIQSIFNEDQGTIDLDLSRPTSQAYDDTPVPQANINTRIAIAGTGDIEEQLSSDGTFKTDVDVIITTAHDNYELLVMNTSAKLIKKGTVGAETWTGYLKSMPFSFEGGVTELRLRRRDITNELVGTVVVNPLDPYDLTISWDTDTLPSDTVFYGPNGDRNKIDYIINPYKTNPTDLKSGNPRILILDSINTSANVGEVEYDGPDGWKNDNGSDFVASANDIVEWDGTAWHIVFNASDEDSTVVYTTNLNTGKQYKYDNDEWTLAFDGEYPNGTWRLAY
tara:strand:+ start:3408 stop:4886 length:1479 start_codon:yes stop_codon:yes gene_type:complete